MPDLRTFDRRARSCSGWRCWCCCWRSPTRSGSRCWPWPCSHPPSGRCRSIRSSSCTAKPSRESFAFEYAAGTVEGDVYSPGRGGRHGAMILILGARPVDRDEPTLVRFAEGLSRTGLVVMVPVVVRVGGRTDRGRGGRRCGSGGRAAPAPAGRRPGPDRHPRASRWADRWRSRPPPTRASTASLVLVNAFGGYFDATDLVRAAATRSLGVCRRRPGLGAGPADPLGDRPADGRHAPGPDGTATSWTGSTSRSDQSARDEIDSMTPVGRAALGLLDGLPPAETEAALAQMPPATIARLQGDLAARVIERLTTRLFIMHDYGDHFVPYTESRRMAAKAPAGRPGAVRRVRSVRPRHAEPAAHRSHLLRRACGACSVTCTASCSTFCRLV